MEVLFGVLSFVTITNCVIIGYNILAVRRNDAKTMRAFEVIDMMRTQNRLLVTNVQKMAEVRMMSVIEGFVKRKNHIIHNKEGKKIICPVCDGSGNLHIGWEVDGHEGDPIDQMTIYKVFISSSRCTACEGSREIDENAWILHSPPTHIRYEGMSDELSKLNKN